jgi:hypothetical protein
MTLAETPTADLIAELRTRENVNRINLDLVALIYRVAEIHRLQPADLRKHARTPAIVLARHQYIAAACLLVPTATHGAITGAINRHRTITHHALMQHEARLQSSPRYAETWAKVQNA